jgi:predicted nucleotidyltransferase
MRVEDALRAVRDNIAGGSHRFHPQLRQILLFGSCAKGSFTLTSDIDLALVFEGEVPPAGEYVETLLAINGEPTLAGFTQFVKTTGDRLAQGQGVFDVNFHIKRDGVVLWDRSTVTTPTRGET